MGILIVEDSETIASLLHALLVDAGYEVVIVSSGEDALGILSECEKAERSECSVDLVLMDIILPGISGLNVCQQMSDMGYVALIPVVFLTASREKSVMAEAFEAGGWDFMVKPVNSSELLLRIKAAIRKGVDLQKRITALG